MDLWISPLVQTTCPHLVHDLVQNIVVGQGQRLQGGRGDGRTIERYGGSSTAGASGEWSGAGAGCDGIRAPLLLADDKEVGGLLHFDHIFDAGRQRPEGRRSKGGGKGGGAVWVGRRGVGLGATDAEVDPSPSLTRAPRGLPCSLSLPPFLPLSHSSTPGTAGSRFFRLATLLLLLPPAPLATRPSLPSLTRAPQELQGPGSAASRRCYCCCGRRTARTQNSA